MTTLQQCPICFKFKLPGSFARKDAECACKKCQGKYGIPGGAAASVPARVRVTRRHSRDNRE